MPPKLSLPPQIGALPARPAASLAALFAGLSLQAPTPGSVRGAHILASLSHGPGATKDRKRVGRGASSGHGRTAGRGHKGRKARGQVNPWFQGGQTPLIRSKGRMGFDNMGAQNLSITNLDQIKQWIDNGRLDASKPITPKELIECGIIGSVKDGIKLLGRGAPAFDRPITITVSRASTSAIEAVEKAGGKITTRYYTRLAILRLLEGKSVHTDKPLPVGKEHVERVLEEARASGFKYRLPDPTSRWDIEYYRDPAHRGYMSHTLEEGENPSLFFGVPNETKARRKVKRQEKEAEEERIF